MKSHYLKSNSTVMRYRLHSEQFRALFTKERNKWKLKYRLMENFANHNNTEIWVWEASFFYHLLLPEVSECAMEAYKLRSINVSRKRDQSPSKVLMTAELPSSSWRLFWRNDCHICPWWLTKGQDGSTTLKVSSEGASKRTETHEQLVELKEPPVRGEKLEIKAVLQTQIPSSDNLLQYVVGDYHDTFPKFSL